MDIVLGFSISIIASVITLIGDRLLKLIRQKRIYSRLKGNYQVCDIDGKPLNNSITKIEYVNGNILDIRNESEKWKGRIIMSNENISWGIGTYKYNEIPDTGIHQIQHDLMNKRIFVHWTNLSHGENKFGSYLLKKIL